MGDRFNHETRCYLYEIIQNASDLSRKKWYDVFEVFESDADDFTLVQAR